VSARHPLPVPSQVVIAGAGVAGLEALLALHGLADGHVNVTVLAPDETFVMGAASVGTAFGHGAPPRHDIASIVAAHGAQFLRDSLQAVRREERVAIAHSGEQLFYDALLVAVGARPEPALAGALTFRGPQDIDLIEGTLRELESGRLATVAFVVPPGIAWPLPVYELALMTAAHVELHGLDVAIEVITPEPAPLALFGHEAAEHAAEALAAANVKVLAATEVSEVGGGGSIRAHGRVVTEAERVIALPRLSGPRIDGLPHDESGFVPVDDRARVPGSPGVYAAGDATTSPLKHGGLGAQQAEHAAREIAQRAGAAVAAPVPRPVLRAQLMEGARSTFLRTPLHARGNGPAIAVTADALWWPPLKVAAPRLATYLGTGR
jgi:sulfide:quinone oxidoreductase